MWKQIAKYPNYEVSTEGEVRNSKTNKILKFFLANGYCNIKLYNEINRKHKSVHRLVALAFLPLVEGKLFVDHIDRNKLNNNVSNLRWVTPSENSNNRDFIMINYKKELHHISIRPNGTFRVEFMSKRKYICYEIFKTKEEAILFRDEFMKNNPK
jgi:hypothetical protein